MKDEILNFLVVKLTLTLKASFDKTCRTVKTLTESHLLKALPIINF